MFVNAMSKLQNQYDQLNQKTSSNNCFGLNYGQRIIGAILSISAGIIMIFLCISSIPAMLLGNFTKFAASYTLANIFFLLTSCFFVGPIKQFKSMFDNKRIYVSIIYMITILLTLYICTVAPYLIYILPIMIIQFISLTYYVISYLPSLNFIKWFSFFIIIINYTSNLILIRIITHEKKKRKKVMGLLCGVWEHSK